MNDSGTESRQLTAAVEALRNRAGPETNLREERIVALYREHAALGSELAAKVEEHPW